MRIAVLGTEGASSALLRDGAKCIAFILSYESFINQTGLNLQVTPIGLLNGYAVAKLQRSGQFFPGLTEGDDAVME